jgi:lysophospholipase L1-like esterase
LKNKNAKVLLIGDSSLLPRTELPYHQTYPVLLKRKVPSCDLEVTAVTSNTSYMILKNIEAYMLYGFDPKAVVLHYGIADVYPRPYPDKVGKLLECLGLQYHIEKWLKWTKLYYRFGDWFGFSAVSLDIFKKNTHDIVKELRQRNVGKIVFVGIIKPDKVLLKSRTVDAKIQEYNKIFRECSRQYDDIHYVDLYAVSNTSFTIWDGYHFTEKASQYLSDTLAEILRC